MVNLICWKVINIYACMLSMCSMGMPLIYYNIDQLKTFFLGEPLDPRRTDLLTATVERFKEQHLKSVNYF